MLSIFKHTHTHLCSCGCPLCRRFAQSDGTGWVWSRPRPPPPTWRLLESKCRRPLTPDRHLRGRKERDGRTLDFKFSIQCVHVHFRCVGFNAVVCLCVYLTECRCRVCLALFDYTAGLKPKTKFCSHACQCVCVCTCVFCVCVGGYLSVFMFKPHLWVRGELPCQQEPDPVRLTVMCCITLVMKKTEHKVWSFSCYLIYSC